MKEYHTYLLMEWAKSIALYYIILICNLQADYLITNMGKKCDKVGVCKMDAISSIWYEFAKFASCASRTPNPVL